MQDKKPTLNGMLYCPYCGGEPRLGRSVYDGSFRVRCVKCGCQTERHETVEDAKERWNKRV